MFREKSAAAFQECGNNHVEFIFFEPVRKPFISREPFELLYDISGCNGCNPKRVSRARRNRSLILWIGETRFTSCDIRYRWASTCCIDNIRLTTLRLETLAIIIILDFFMLCNKFHSYRRYCPQSSSQGTSLHSPAIIYHQKEI